MLNPIGSPFQIMEDSLSIGDMVFNADYSTSPVSSDPNTILVALGTRSSFGLGGPGIGMLLTRNALDPNPTWSSPDNNVFFHVHNIKFNSVYMSGTLMLASAYEAITMTVPMLAFGDQMIAV